MLLTNSNFFRREGVFGEETDFVYLGYTVKFVHLCGYIGANGLRQTFIISFAKCSLHLQDLIGRHSIPPRLSVWGVQFLHHSDLFLKYSVVKVFLKVIADGVCVGASRTRTILNISHCSWPGLSHSGWETHHFLQILSVAIFSLVPKFCALEQSGDDLLVIFVSEI